MRFPGRAARLVAVVPLCALWLWALNLARYVHTPSPEGAARVEIPKGASRDRIAAILHDCGLAPWQQGASWGLRLWGHTRAAKAGIYAFKKGSRLVDVFGDIEAGHVDLVTVTLPEGLDVREMGQVLETAGVTRAADFVALALDPSSPSIWDVPGPSLEGFLFPDTYRFAREVPARVVIDAMVRRFRRVAAELKRPSRETGLDLLGWVTLASIVEKETGNPEEKKLVAAVFLNRLQRGMLLQSDPTVIYGIPNFDGDLRREDLRRDTPYNTYVHPGLPPGPICSPGRASLEAVSQPANVPYLYFVSRNDGTHEFSVTYDDHRRAVARYQKVRRP